MDKLTPEQQTALLQIGAIPAALLVAAVLGLAIWKSRREAAKRRDLKERELAVMVEETSITFGGMVSGAMLALTILASISLFAAAKSAIHEIEAAVVLLAGSVLCGMGIVLGRTRSYRIYRSEHREPM